MIIHNPILTGSFTVNGTDVASITSSAASLTSLNAYTASQNILNGTYATTSSNTFAGIQTVNSNLVVTGSITAQTLVVQTVTSSVVYSSGSNVFGNNIANTQTFTGSVNVSGSGTFTGIVGVGGATEAGWSLKSNGNLKVENSNGTTVLQVNDTSTGGKAWSLISAGAGNAHSVAAGAFYLRNSSDSSTAFTIASTGAATFSSTISAGVITGDSNSTGTPSIVAKVGSGGNNGTFGFGNNSNYRIRGGSDYGAMIFDTAGAEQMRITGGGTPTFQIGTYAGNSDIQLTASTTGYSSVLFGDGASGSDTYRGYVQYQHNGDYMLFATSATERMRITSGGQVITTMNAVNNNVVFEQNSTNPYGPWFKFTTDANNGTNYYWVASALVSGSETVRAKLLSNGGLANYQSNNTNLSDVRTKKDITPLESYWNKFKDIEIVKFKYKDQTHDDFNIGVIAQQIEEVAPEFVDIDGFGETPEDGIPYKTIYTSDLHHATIKVLQEAMAKIEQLEAEINELKNK
jgi:hypothetical protein